ncbi:MAG: response regulator [Candidatus Woesearchaeota archaeon]|jgi:CheY-like chemotaxis protein
MENKINMLNETINVLVIDDKPENIDSAKRNFARFDQGEVYRPKFNITYVKNGKSALEEVASSKYNIVLSDLFLHYTDLDTPANYIENIENNLWPALSTAYPNRMEAAKAWTERGEAPPLGLLIGIKAKEANPSTVVCLCTDTYHHDNLAEPVYQRVNKFEIGLDDITSEIRKYLQSCDCDKEKAIKELTFLHDEGFTEMDFNGKYWMRAIKCAFEDFCINRQREL